MDRRVSDTVANRTFDRTQTMTAAQVERFWVEATREALKQVSNRIEAIDGITDVLQGNTLERIAAEALARILPSR